MIANLKEELLHNISLPIGDVAKATNVHLRTLRIYDEAGILSPKRSNTNRRKYTIKDINRLDTILFLTQSIGINIAGVKTILAILDKFKVKPENYYSIINEIAESINIDEVKQEANIKKYSKRGRRKLEKI